MNLPLRLALLLAVGGSLLLNSNLSAGDKKPEEKKPAEKKKPPAKDVVVDGELINADLKDKVHQQSYCKTYTFKMEKGVAYQIELSSPAFQPVLRLENAAGTQVAQAIDQTGIRRAMMFYTASKTEDFEIIATTLNGNGTGKFSLVIKDASRTTVLAVTAKLDQNDKGYANAGNKKHKFYTVELEEGRTYQIDMTSPNFDSYLYFESPEGKVLAADDDGGGYPSARIIHKAAKTGKYKVVCTHFGGGGNLGEFTVTMRQTDGGPAPINRDKRFDDKK